MNRFHMALMAVHAAVTQKTHEMEPIALTGFGLSQRIEQNLIVVELALVDIFVDQGQILIDDPAGAEDHMADFGIAHLARRQTDIDAGHGKTRVRIVAQHRIEIRRRSVEHRIAFFSRIDAESIQDDQNHGFAVTQDCFLSPSPARRKQASEQTIDAFR